MIIYEQNWYITVWSEGFLYKVAPPELKISSIIYFVIHNLLVLVLGIGYLTRVENPGFSHFSGLGFLALKPGYPGFLFQA